MATKPAKLATLKPKLQVLDTRRVPTMAAGRDSTPRLRGRKWMERRAAWLRKNPLCQDCLDEGRVNAKELEVDHVVPLYKGGKDDESNYRTRCKEHHKAKTAQDMGYQPKTEVGLDGWPIT